MTKAVCDAVTPALRSDGGNGDGGGGVDGCGDRGNGGGSVGGGGRGFSNALAGSTNGPETLITGWLRAWENCVAFLLLRSSTTVPTEDSSDSMILVVTRTLAADTESRTSSAPTFAFGIDSSIIVATSLLNDSLASAPKALSSPLSRKSIVNGNL